MSKHTPHNTHNEKHNEEKILLGDQEILKSDLLTLNMGPQHPATQTRKLWSMRSHIWDTFTAALKSIVKI